MSGLVLQSLRDDGGSTMYNRLLLLPDLRELLVAGDTEGVAGFCEALHPAAVADVLEGLAAAPGPRAAGAARSDLWPSLVMFLNLKKKIFIGNNFLREKFFREKIFLGKKIFLRKKSLNCFKIW